MAHGHGHGYLAGCEQCRADAARRQADLRNRGRDIPADAHGTNSTFVNYRCHDEHACPGHPETGETCREAHRAYQRDYTRRTRNGTNHTASESETSNATHDLPAS